MSKEYHAHPIQIIINIWKLLILLIIPLLRGILNAFTGNFKSWLEGAWLDICIVMIILGVGIIMWYRTTYRIEQEGIYLNRGIFFRKNSFIPKKNILSCVITHNFYLRPFNAVRVRADTLGGSFKNADFNIILNKEKAKIFSESISENQNHFIPLYKSNLIYVIILSLISSNSFAGILLITTFISNLGDALGKKLSDRIFDTFRHVSQKLAFGIPPAAANIAFVLFAGWCVAFVRNVIKYRNLTISKSSDFVDIKSGIFTINQCRLHTNAINYFDIRQTLVTKILGISYIFVSAIGFGKSEDDVSAFVPSVKNKNINKILKHLDLGFKPKKRQLKPNLGSFIRFTADPLYFCALIPLTSYILIMIYPEWKDFLISIALIPMIPAIWFFTVRFIDCFTSGIAKSGNYYTLKYSKGFYFHETIIPKDKIISVKLKQSIFQKFSGRCDLFVYNRSEGIQCHKCRNLKKDDVLILFGNKVK